MRRLWTMSTVLLVACGGRVSEPILPTVDRSSVVPGEIIDSPGDDGGEDSGGTDTTDGGGDSGQPFTGGCVEFFGEGDHFGGTDAALPLGDDARTVEFWFKHENVVGLDSAVAWGASGATFVVGFYNGFPSVWANGTAYYGSSNSWADGEWHHFGAVWDPASEQVGIWIDGVQDTALPASVDTSAGGVFWLGDDATVPNGGSGYVGVMDELHIWNKALGSGEFGALFDSAPLGMVAWYQMNQEGEGAGLVMPDQAGSTDLTSAGAPAFVPCGY